MREVNIPIEINTVNIETITVAKEEIIAILERKKDKSIEITIEQKDSEDNKVREDVKIINGENFDLLMSENPFFAPNKPKNEYRESDLWCIIDIIRNN